MLSRYISMYSLSSAGSNTPVPDSDPLDQCNGHGTHVAVSAHSLHGSDFPFTAYLRRESSEPIPTTHLISAAWLLGHL